MLLLDNNGYIIGFNTKEDNKPAPFPIDKARWNGKDWEYPEIDKKLIEKKNIPSLIEKNIYDSFSILCRIQEKISPSSGKKVKEKSKDITILIPSYKKSKWVLEAVNSALNQTLKPYRVIILAMTDDDFEALKDVNNDSVTVIKNEQLNASAARNKLVTLCPTEYFVFLDADDILADNFLETVYNAKATIVGTPIKECIPPIARRYNTACMNLTVLLHKEVWNEIGGLREDLALGGEDCFFLNEIFIQNKWLVDYTISTWYDYRHVDENSLFTKDKSTHYLLSVEKELYLHKDWYKKCLSESSEPNYKSVSFLFEKFLKEYNGKNESGIPLRIEFIDYSKKDNIEIETLATNIAINEDWNENSHLFLESRLRNTDCICYDTSQPQLYGRKFDLFVYSQPSFDWNEINNIDGISSNGCYINNPKIDLSRPVKELLNEFCVCFSEKLQFATMKIPTNEIEKRIEDLKKEIEKTREELKIDNDKGNIYTLAFFSKCNKNCFYCSQKTLETNLNEDTLYKNFLITMDKLEELHGKNFRINLSGGEITLCSDEFARKIMKRLEGYRVQLLTNGYAYLESPFYDYPNLTAYVHLVEPPFDDSFLREYDSSCIVANRKDLPEIIKAIKANKLRPTCRIPLYTGLDESLFLTDKDTKELNSALAEKGIIRPEPKEGNMKECLKKDYVYRQVNIWELTVYPCCAFNESSIPLSEWKLQSPSGKVCSTCSKMIYD